MVERIESFVFPSYWDPYFLEAVNTLVKQIARMATDPSNNRPFRPVKITHIKIVTAASAATSATPAKKPTAPATKPQ